MERDSPVDTLSVFTFLTARERGGYKRVGWESEQLQTANEGSKLLTHPTDLVLKFPCGSQTEAITLSPTPEFPPP